MKCNGNLKETDPNRKEKIFIGIDPGKNGGVAVLNDVPDMLRKKDIRMTLDYQEDFDFFKTVIENLDNDFSLEDVLHYIEDNENKPE